MDPPEFMLTPHTMTNAEYNSWRSGIPYADQFLDGLDYEEFNITRLMPSLTILVYAQSLLLLFQFLYLFVMASKGGKLQQEEPTAGEPIDPPHLPWMVYAYDLDGFA